jgi:hypothetical protein
MAGTPTYFSWEGMIQRCTNRRYPKWENYGGRGITVCDRWKSFVNFLADMGERPDGKTLDRIDNDGNYEPDNCRWATLQEQRANQREWLRKRCDRCGSYLAKDSLQSCHEKCAHKPLRNWRLASEDEAA